MKTYSAKPSEIEKKWVVINAERLVVVRLATLIALRLRGKHKPIYAPHIDTGDHVVVVNASKVSVTAGKETKKIYYRHSGYPGSLRERTLADQMERDPTEVIKGAVRGMLPKNRLGRQMIKKLHVYPGDAHSNESQKPQPFELDPRSRRGTSEESK